MFVAVKKDYSAFETRYELTFCEIILLFERTVGAR